MCGYSHGPQNGQFGPTQRFLEKGASSFGCSRWARASRISEIKLASAQAELKPANTIGASKPRRMLTSAAIGFYSIRPVHCPRLTTPFFSAQFHPLFRHKHALGDKQTSSRHFGLLATIKEDPLRGRGKLWASWFQFQAGCSAGGGGY